MNYAILKLDLRKESKTSHSEKSFLFVDRQSP